MTSLTVIVFRSGSQSNKDRYTNILKVLLNSSLDKQKYEVIFLGNTSDRSRFYSTVIYREPLVRGFYDGFPVSRGQRINAAVEAAHCDMILLWPGLYFEKRNFKPIPADVVNADYYLMLWLRFNQAAEDWPWWFDGKGCKPEHPIFGRQQYAANLKDTLRFFYKLDEVSFRVKVWYFGWLIRSIGRGLIKRGAK